MAYYWLKFKIWTKIIFVSLSTIYVALFIYENISHQVDIWFWYKSTYTTTTPALILVSFLLGVLVTLLARILFDTFRQIRQLREMRQPHPASATPPTEPRPPESSPGPRPQ